MVLFQTTRTANPTGKKKKEAATNRQILRNSPCSSTTNSISLYFIINKQGLSSTPYIIDQVHYGSFTLSSSIISHVSNLLTCGQYCKLLIMLSSIILLRPLFVFSCLGKIPVKLRRHCWTELIDRESLHPGIYSTLTDQPMREIPGINRVMDQNILHASKINNLLKIASPSSKQENNADYN